MLSLVTCEEMSPAHAVRGPARPDSILQQTDKLLLYDIVENTQIHAISGVFNWFLTQTPKCPSNPN